METAEFIKIIVFSQPTNVTVIIFSEDGAQFQYNITRDTVKSHKSKICPVYESVTLPKSRCYSSSLTITDKTEVSLHIC